MGGLGSTRWGDYKRKWRVEECLALDVTEFLDMPAGTTMKVSWGNNELGAIRTEDALKIRYQLMANEQFVQEQIKLGYNTKSHRCYWTCPGCSRQVNRLYKPMDAQLFRCRHCHDLTYRCVQERRKHTGMAKHMASISELSVSDWEYLLNNLK